MLQTMTETPSGNRDERKPLPLPKRSAQDLESLGRALAVIAAGGHDRVTVKQSLFFMSVAYAHAMNHSVTLTDILSAYEGTGALGGAVRKSYNVFFEKNARFPDALGWIKQEEDPDDRRFKFLKLTERGEEVAADIVEAMRG